MPRSVFLGRVVAEGEPLFLDEDRAWAFALAEAEADTCPECRQPWSEATDPANEFKYRAEPIRCHACATTAKTVKAKTDKGESIDGLHIHLQLEQPNGR